jgi:protein-L-isoaspartate O-methyltransferase
VVAAVPRHEFVPRWWDWDDNGWTAIDGLASRGLWMRAAYSDRTLITQLGTMHADHARPGDRPDGRPTSSATQPGLVVAMYRHAGISDGSRVLDVGTGSGYGTALLARRLGDQLVTSIDVDDYLVKAAAGRLDAAGLRPGLVTGDATGPLPGSYDRIVSMMSVAPVPASWLEALRPGGRLVTTIAGTGLLVTADKTSDGGAAGRTEWYRAGFMTARSGADYPPVLLDQHPEARDGDASTGRYPLVNIGSAWELMSMLGVTVPGIQDHYRRNPDGTRTAWLLAPDGSWARAIATGDEPPAVLQSGPRRLWDLVDDIRHAWLTDGRLPAYGALVTITPDGGITLKKGSWHAEIPAG